MKKKIACRLWSCLVGSLLLGPVQAQSTGDVAKVSLRESDRTAITANPGITVNASIQRAFGQTFKEAQAPFWRQAVNKKGVLTNRYAVEFKTGDRRGLALFSEKGKMLYTVLYGTVSHLPNAEKELLKANYEGYQITHAHHVTTSADKLWVVLLQNCTHLVKTRIMEGEVYELERYKKSE